MNKKHLHLKPITHKWDTEVKPIVSIRCITYNHEDVIEDALKGFLIQKTSFPVKIIIFDDCSTDQTSNILRRYQRLFPHLISLFIMDKNTYHQPIRREKARPFEEEVNKAKYIAFCEGDDYWIDPYKLQKQVDFLDKNNDCSLCFHPVKNTYSSVNKDDEIVGLPFKYTTTISSKEVNKGIFVRLVSAVYRKDCILALPNWVYEAPVGDLALQLHLTLKGNFGYLGSEVMSVYRRGRVGAWSELENTKDKNTRRRWDDKWVKDQLNILNTFNKFSDFKFNSEIKIREKKVKRYYLSRVFEYSSKSEQLKLIKNNYLNLIDIRKRSILKAWCFFVLGYHISKKLFYAYKKLGSHIGKSELTLNK